MMAIACFIEYKLNPFKLDQFEEYADNWAASIPENGGHLLGYFMPHEGSNYKAYGIILFESLADYEQYRIRLKKSASGKSNFTFAMKEQFILEEKRSFLKLMDSTFNKKGQIAQ
jgi:hypothetical protein